MSVTKEISIYEDLFKKGVEICIWFYDTNAEYDEFDEEVDNFVVKEDFYKVTYYEWENQGGE